MAFFRCKMCGGSLEIGEGQSIATCEYCGTRQTLPRLDDERRAQMYDRANHFRRNNEFDMAMGIYNQILSEDKTDAEAYWSLVLCRYGIEYVDDPASGRRVPTVNRTQYTSIFNDPDYKLAIENADTMQRAILESEAKEISEIQKGILDISLNEKPFDVFICYKETDSRGQRTVDSVLAQDLYDRLSGEGMRVFFARITLEDKLGIAFEPYIFAALNSAKVMVVLGTRAEHFNATWVKNEWSRFLSIAKQSGGEKLLIPAYKDMDPRMLPEEFTHLQGQDMNKIGFMQDLVRGILKITKPVKADEQPAVIRETVVKEVSAVSNIEPLLKRAFIFLGDSDWAGANEYAERVLDMDPECGEAYLVKLLADLRITNKNNLSGLKRSFEDNKNYKKIITYGSPELKAWVADQLNSIKQAIKTAERERIKNEKESDSLAKEYEEILRAGAKLLENKSELEKLKTKRDKLTKIAGDIPAINMKIGQLGRFIKDKNAEKARAQSERSSLGVFAFGRKKELDSIIAGLQVEIDKATSEMKSLQRKAGSIKTPEEAERSAFELGQSIEQLSAEIRLAEGSEKRIKELRAALNGIEGGDAKLREVERMIKHEGYCPGKIITFGKYRGVNLDWIVLRLDKPQDAVLLISANVVDCGPFGQFSKHYGWRQSLLRDWLNKTFLNEAFTKGEIAKIYTNNITDQRSDRHALGQYPDDDRLYALTIEEANAYSQYVLKRCKHINDKNYYYNWWLRSKGAEVFDGCVASYVTHDAAVCQTITANLRTIGIRPVMWLSIK